MARLCPICQCDGDSHNLGRRCVKCGHGGAGQPPPASAEPDVLVVVISEENALVEYLQALNDGGIDPTVAGMDDRQQPFLAMLRGPYAESRVVLFNDPWDGEVTREATRCEDCMAADNSTFADLAFPVVVMVNS